MRLDKISQKVSEILRRFPEARNSDKKLFWLLIQEYYGVGQFIDDKKFFQLPSFESIRRVRQKIQQELLFPPTDWRVAKQRKWEEREWQKALGYYVESKGQMVML